MTTTPTPAANGVATPMKPPPQVISGVTRDLSSNEIVRQAVLNKGGQH